MDVGGGQTSSDLRAHALDSILDARYFSNELPVQGHSLAIVKERKK